MRLLFLLLSALTLAAAQSCDATVVPNFRIGCRTRARLSAVAPEPSETGTWTIGAPVTGDQPPFSRVLLEEPNDPNALVTNITLSGIYTFTWTVRQGGCPDKVKQLRIRKIVDQDLLDGLDADPGAEPAREVDMWCKNSYNLMGNVPGALARQAGLAPNTGITGTWSSDTAGVTFTNRTLNTAIAQNIPEGDFNIMRWTIDYTPACNSAVDHVLIRRRRPVTAASAGVRINNGCGMTSDMLANLAGNAVAFLEQGTWTVKAGAGIFADANDPTTAVTGINTGSNTYTWSITNATEGCTSTADVEVVRPVDPTSTVGANVMGYCWKPITAATPATVFPNSLPLAGNQPTVGLVGLWSDQGPAVPGTAFDTPALHNTRVTLGAPATLPNTQTFRWTVSVEPGARNPCTAATADKTVETTHVMTVPVVSSTATAGTPPFFIKDCGEDTHTMDATTPAGAQTGRWSTVTGTGLTGAGTFDDATSPTAIVSNLAVGVNRFRFSHELMGCTSAIPNPGNDLDIIVPPQLTTVNPGANQLQICGTQTTLTAPALAPGLKGRWVTAMGSVATVTNIASPTSTVTGLATNGVPAYLDWRVDGINAGGACQEVRSQRIILVAPTGAVTPANAGPDFDLNCNEDRIDKMDANIPVTNEEEGLWTVVEGAGTFMYPELHDTPVTGIGFGRNVFRWTIRRTDCLTGDRISMDDLVVIRPEQPTAAAGPDQLALCSASVKLNANRPTVGQQGYWTARPRPAMVAFANANEPNTTATITQQIGNILTFTWTVRAAGNCRARTDTVNIIRPLTLPTIQVTAPPLSTNPGPLPQYDAGCQASFTVTATAPGTGNTALWSSSNAGVTFTDSSMASTTLNIAASAYTTPPSQQLGHLITYTISRPADCAAASNSVFQWILIIGENPATLGANAGPSQTPWCLPTLAGGPGKGLNAVFGANPRNQGQIGTWSVAGSPATIVNPNSPTSTITGLTANAAPITFTWSVAVTGVATGCPADTATRTLTVPKLLTANAGPNQCLDCGVFETNVTASPLVGMEFGVWSKVAGPGLTNAGNIISPGELSTRIDGLAPGVNRFRWTVADNDVCSGGGVATDEVDVIIPVRADAGPNIDLDCLTGEGTFAANAGTPCQTGVWTQVNQFQTGATVAVATGTSPTSNFVAPEGEFTMRWTLTNQGATTCPTYFDDVIIERGTITNANAGPDQDVGCGTTATLAANSVAPGENGVWSVSPFNGVKFTNPSDPNTTVTEIQPGLNRLTWTISKPRQCICTACQPKQDTMTLRRTVAVTPANAGINRHVCASTATVNGNTPIFGVGTWSVVSGAGSVDNPSSPVTGVSGLAFGQSTTFQWAITSTGCADSSTSTVVYTRFAELNAGADQTLSGSNAVATLTGTGNNTAEVTWTVVAGQGTFSDPNSLTTTVSNMLASNRFRLTYNTCPDFYSEVSVFVSGGGTAAPTPAPTPPAQACLGGVLSGNSCNCNAGVQSCVCSPGTDGITDGICNCNNAVNCQCLAPLATCNGQNATTVTANSGSITLNCGNAQSCTVDTPPPTTSGSVFVAPLFALLAAVLLFVQ